MSVRAPERRSILAETAMAILHLPLLLPNSGVATKKNKTV
jgi:hypothetical protein